MKRGYRALILWTVTFAVFAAARAEGAVYTAQQPRQDTVAVAASAEPTRKAIHRIGIEAHPVYVFPESRIPGEEWNPRGSSFSGHLKYSFQLHPNSVAGRTYAGAYQGLGIGWFSFGDRSDYLGKPLSAYLFQGARIAGISPQWAFKYEWNFGLSAPWDKYDPLYNPYNNIVGSKVNAYIDIAVYLSWMPVRQLEFTAGVSVTHFSNGNTKFPNAGLNTIGAKLGVIYHFRRNGDEKPGYKPSIPHFPRHVSYDLVLFGSWRKRGVLNGSDEIMILPDAYTVLGFSFSPMYNFGHNFRAGLALDGFYDSSANLIYTDDITPFDSRREGSGYAKPALKKQLALGVSGRVEFVMPYFTIGLGVGSNLLHAGGDMKSVYQTLSLKVEVTRNSFVHIGYSLHNFSEPNFLMLGLGFRFNNKSPLPYRSR